MRLLRSLCSSLLLCAAGLPVFAAPARYVLDPVHTRVQFAVDHAGFSKAIGTVSGSTGTLMFDPDDWQSARVEVTIPIGRIDLGDAKWNQATLARGLLDAERHPVATFVSKRIEPIDAQRAIVHGDLTLRGETREVALQVVLNALKRHPLPPFRRTVGFSATGMLSRSEFGVDAWKSMIGDAVELRLEVEATRSRGDADATDGTDEADASDAPDADTPAPDADVDDAALPAPPAGAGR